MLTCVGDGGGRLTGCQSLEQRRARPFLSTRISRAGSGAGVSCHQCPLALQSLGLKITPGARARGPHSWAAHRALVAQLGLQDADRYVWPLYRAPLLLGPSPSFASWALAHLPVPFLVSSSDPGLAHSGPSDPLLSLEPPLILLPWASAGVPYYITAFALASPGLLDPSPASGTCL